MGADASPLTVNTISTLTAMMAPGRTTPFIADSARILILAMDAIQGAAFLALVLLTAMLTNLRPSTKPT